MSLGHVLDYRLESAARAKHIARDPFSCAVHSFPCLAYICPREGIKGSRFFECVFFPTERLMAEKVTRICHLMKCCFPQSISCYRYGTERLVKRQKTVVEKISRRNWFNVYLLLMSFWILQASLLDWISFIKKIIWISRGRVFIPFS